MPNTIETFSDKQAKKHKGFIHSFADVSLDPHLDLMADFYVRRFPADELKFEHFLRNPEHAWSIYGRTSKPFEKLIGE